MSPDHLPSALPDFHLAQVNVAINLGSPDSPVMAEFMALLKPINKLADGSPGFVWRLQTEAGDATALRVFGDDSLDDGLMVNLSVWQDLQSLWNYAYASRHLEVMRRRREWFQRMSEPYMALWWIPAGRLPTVSDAEERLTLLRREGPSPRAFTFKVPFSCEVATSMTTNAHPGLPVADYR